MNVKCLVALALAVLAAEAQAGDCCKKEQPPPAAPTSPPPAAGGEPIFVPPPPQAYGRGPWVSAQPQPAYLPPAPYPIPVSGGQPGGFGAAPPAYPGYPVRQPVLPPGYQPGFGPGTQPYPRVGQTPPGCACRR